MLGQLNLFDKKDKLHKTLDRICEFEPKEGYYLAFSGGKDSQCIYHLCKMAGAKFDAHFNLTTVDPPELVYFIRKNYPNVEIHRPEKTMWQLIPEKMMPPTRVLRYCCEVLKEGGGAGRHVATGIRWQESNKRKQRRMNEVCMRDKSKTFFHGIIDWDIGEVWEFLQGNKIEHCCLYDSPYRFKRIGCIGCPMGSKKERLKHFSIWPTYKNQYIKAFDRMLKSMDGKGIEHSWKTADEVYERWINEQPKGNPDQTIIIE